MFSQDVEIRKVALKNIWGFIEMYFAKDNEMMYENTINELAAISEYQYTIAYSFIEAFFECYIF